MGFVLHNKLNRDHTSCGLQVRPFSIAANEGFYTTFAFSSSFYLNRHCDQLLLTQLLITFFAGFLIYISVTALATHICYIYHEDTARPELGTHKSPTTSPTTCTVHGGRLKQIRRILESSTYPKLYLNRYLLSVWRTFLIWIESLSVHTELKLTMSMQTGLIFRPHHIRSPWCLQELRGTWSSSRHVR